VNAQPSGALTFLFTDIEGSTRLWEDHPEAMRGALLQHDLLLRACIETHGGRVFKTVGDAFCAVFTNPRQAVETVLAGQQWLPALAMDTAAGIMPLRVRMALHAGIADERDGDYFGPPVNRVARLLGLGHGGQVLLSLASAELVRNDLPAGATLRELGEFSLKDLGVPERVAQLLHPDLPDEFPPLRSLDRPPARHNLPQSLTRFVGRSEEVRQWTALIRERSQRLFTLTGFGGLGKTRTALRLAEALVPDFPDGVWWCNLEHATGVDDALAAVVRGVAIPLRSSPSVREQLIHYLRGRNTLLVLDNVEQVAGGPGLLRDLITETTGVVCLVTSRRTMDLRGERVLELAPLSGAESVRLFAERAAECRGDFTMDVANERDVRELCRRLEGVPLAIELAAARVAGMTPRQILQRLTERFRLLQSRSPDMNERQRALRGAIDWSYQLLSEEDRLVFAQLAVFSGGFTLEDAEAVCEAFDVFESVMSLRRQSLLRSEGEGEQARFVMLDSLREYGVEKLAETRAESAARLRHARHFLQYGRERLGRLRTAGEPAALDQLERSSQNLRAALDWAGTADDPVLFAELALAAGSAQHRRGFLQGAAEILQSGLDAVLPQAQDHPAITAGLLLERAGLNYDFGEAEACAQLAAEARKWFEQAANPAGEARVENVLGQAAMAQRDYAGALTHYRTAGELFRQAGNRVGVAIALNNQGLAERRNAAGTPEEIAERRARAGEQLDAALGLRRELDDRRGLAETHNNLGVLAFELDHFDEAGEHYLHALGYERQIGNLHGMGVALANLGEVRPIQERPVEALRLLAAAELVLAEVGSPLAGGVREMLEELAGRLDVPPDDLQAQRIALQALSISECCDWALTSENDRPGKPKELYFLGNMRLLG
jgi:predicted ATPase/class 3 adenylate cyclase